jgi:formate dehydrogenase subunit gamma
MVFAGSNAPHLWTAPGSATDRYPTPVSPGPADDDDGTDVFMELQLRQAVAQARAGGGEGLLLPAVHAVQDAVGHVPDEAIAVLADEFNLSRADVLGVVSFYRDFRRSPAGRTVVRVCRAEACRSVGAVQLADDVQARLGLQLGATGDDGAVTLDEVFCLGNCALGPSASVDGRVIGRATVERILDAVSRASASTDAVPASAGEVLA